MLAGLLLLSSCYEDKGNYSYDEIPEITVENLPKSISIVQKAGYIELNPVIKSSTEGVINENNPNYEFGCILYLQAGAFSDGSRWVDINKEKTMKVNCLADFDTGNYLVWYTIKDKRSGVTKNVTVDVKITSATYEGWMVLSDVGNENLTRLDMISVFSKEDKKPIYDILGANAPKLKNSVKVLFDAWPRQGTGDIIWLSTKEGTYSLNANTLKTQSIDNLMKSSFILNMGDETAIAADALPFIGRFVVTNKGNLFVQNTRVGGGAFELPINTLKEDGDPEFKVAPFIGIPQMRPYTWDGIALLYDTDNQRFLGWDVAKGNGSHCFVLGEPENKLFSFTTRKKLISMVNTKFNNGTIYSILEDDAKNRSIYGINLAGGTFTQTYYQQMSTPGFAEANQFAFHSQYPYLFYSAGNQIYCYHLMNASLSQPLSLEGEEITLLKFNLFQTEKSKLSDSSDEFMEQEYYLIVGSYKKTATNENGGTLRFYKFDQTTKTLTKVSEYSGFGRIRDVTYRERCN